MYSLGFGIEKLGLLAVRSPRIVLAVVLLFCTLAALGLPKLTSDAALSELFRSDTPEFVNYKKLSDNFPTSEFDILAVVEGKDLTNRDLLEEIRTLHLELQFAESVDGILSLFSMRDAPGETGPPPPMFPADLPEGEEFDALMKRALEHPLIGDKLLSKRDENGQLALLVISIDPKVSGNSGLKRAIEEIEQLAHEVIDPTGMTVRLAGAPVMQLEVRTALKRDRLIFNTAGFLVGFLICFAFFRRPKLVAIASLCPALAVLLALGLLGHIGVKLNTFLNAIPPLVMVIALSDALHMVYSIRRKLREGVGRVEAARHAVLTVGPACVLTSLTTSVAMATLALTDSAVIRTFGLCAALATLMAFFVVITIVPMVSILWITDKDEKEFEETEHDTRHKALARLEEGCAHVGNWLKTRHVGVAAVGLVILFVFAGMYAQLEPRYRLSDQLPDNKQATAASERIDAKLTGAVPVHIMLRWSDGDSIESASVQEAIAEAHALLEDASGIGNVWSVETLKRWLKENMDVSATSDVADYVRKMPKHLAMRFINEKANSIVVTGRLPNLDADETVPIVEALDEKLGALRAKYPTFEFTVTGLATLSSLQAASMIDQLNRGLIAAVVVVILLIGLAFRSWAALGMSIVPNLFPIVAAGAVLYAMGAGLEYSSVIGLTVAFGLAVDDTIHFLSRLHLERARRKTMAEAVHETIVRIGPVLVLTTIVLVLGMSVTIFSQLPPMRLFGQLSMTMLSAALIGDVLLLPAIILTVLKFWTARLKV